MASLDQYLLARVAEECDETGQAFLKLFNFGIMHRHPVTKELAITKAAQEVNDVLGTIDFLREVGVVIYGVGRPEAITAKKVKIFRNMQLSIDEGRLVLSNEELAALNALYPDEKPLVQITHTKEVKNKLDRTWWMTEEDRDQWLKDKLEAGTPDRDYFNQWTSASEQFHPNPMHDEELEKMKAILPQLFNEDGTLNMFEIMRRASDVIANSHKLSPEEAKAHLTTTWQQQIAANSLPAEALPVGADPATEAAQWAAFDRVAGIDPVIPPKALTGVVDILSPEYITSELRRLCPEFFNADGSLDGLNAITACRLWENKKKYPGARSSTLP